MKLSGHHIRSAIQSGVWAAWHNNERLTADRLHINPNSVDVTLHRTLLAPRLLGDEKILDPLDGRNLEWSKYDMTPARGFVLHPGMFVLGAVRERFDCSTPLDIGVTEDVSHESGLPEGTLSRKITDVRFFAPMIDGRSTVGRIGIGVHVTAGFGDYGFAGAFTLEITNSFRFPVVLTPFMRIGQVSFDEVSAPDQTDTYRGAYSGVNHNDGPVPPQLGRHRFV